MIWTNLDWRIGFDDLRGLHEQGELIDPRSKFWCAFGHYSEPWDYPDPSTGMSVDGWRLEVDLTNSAITPAFWVGDFGDLRSMVQRKAPAAWLLLALRWAPEAEYEVWCDYINDAMKRRASPLRSRHAPPVVYFYEAAGYPPAALTSFSPSNYWDGGDPWYDAFERESVNRRRKVLNTGTSPTGMVYDAGPEEVVWYGDVRKLYEGEKS